MPWSSAFLADGDMDLPVGRVLLFSTLFRDSASIHCQSVIFIEPISNFWNEEQNEHTGSMFSGCVL
jgi:hypothetical protein